MDNDIPIYVAYIEIFGDDVSGNTSKAWNEHWNQYLSHRNLLRRVFLHEFHVHFVSAWRSVPVYDQFAQVKGVIEETQCEPF